MYDLFKHTSGNSSGSLQVTPCTFTLYRSEVLQEVEGFISLRRHLATIPSLCRTGLLFLIHHFVIPRSMN